jgi:hypothetical protein
MQVAEPTFPLAQPPTCLKCCCAANRVRAVRSSNPISHAGRLYYRCSHCVQKYYTFITFDDDIGIIPSNPRCDCGYISRISRRRDGDGQFYCCPVGTCQFLRDGPLLPPARMPMQTAAKEMKMNISGSSAETEPTRPSSSLVDALE